ncbi:helix-turn-helix domain-containing protein [Bradyrhizobium sp. U87765 SZCCT0131]|uniref:helix-turn-helix transcriptional regulator n=1 Tax=unclassified Bradyrhizobium TaxID=2631580 RepID=UPI001BAD0832|nr:MULTISPECIES: helix-turn-helix transcriptional regulator [unclassified Bradyrhizobium]MBR1216881.1 helix-turn-helix domain-containing protein [Bradyrhizobium sp. U87765 SZCCT0131]MBR1259363.1 helix-turn-helix domain-containing protein [Bradyrhizobium sp. U87765 SZCCT0134]MBR1305504.1 helix-turn-helix domain-containing protein [Bradyrhizobium sp. U87765 SZCCT0110]MBR1321871.1 helix-turn-helix domain-containing protein [Bradyrhizobium sp. U87765 SZCCT0109]MBR1350851.1 helix-turn-helix domain-
MTSTDSRSASRHALGTFLRTRRERLPVPPTASGRRRTPGLRREEVAEACGVSHTWITWLEQGRDVSASPHALARLAEALRLVPAERTYLFELAGKRDPAAPVAGDDDLPPQVLALPDRMTISAYLLDHTWMARAWNADAAALFTGWLDGDHDRNLLRFIFLSPAAQRLIVDWDERARRVVAEFRADVSRRLRDPSMQALIEDLMTRSAVFARLWQEQAVLGREGGERLFDHPRRRYYQSTLLLSSHPDIKLISLTPLAG